MKNEAVEPFHESSYNPSMSRKNNINQAARVVPVILSGGGGSRLWPLSRTAYPKQFFSLIDKELSLFQQALQRVKDRSLFTPPIVVCNEEHRFVVAEQSRAILPELPHILLEPCARNTAPAIALAAYHAQKIDADAVIAVMPSDHQIQDVTALHAAIDDAVAACTEGHIVLFGIAPTRPESGLGYIQKKAITAEHSFFNAAGFVEKPAAEKAQEMLKSGEYFWNSGMCVCSASTYISALRRHAPLIAEATWQAYSGAHSDLDFFRVDAKAFHSCPSDSVDYAILEKEPQLRVVSLQAGWSDVGNFESLWEASEKDGDGNAVHAKHAITQDAHHNLIYSDKQMVAVQGLDHVVVIATNDAVLVTHKNQSQKMKSLVENIEKTTPSLVEKNQRVYRPWGYYEILTTGAQHQVKRLLIKPRQKLSLQSHQHRAEHWVVVNGAATILRDAEIVELYKNQSIYIPSGVQHRIENAGDSDLEIIEVQSGSYLGEDDIVRIEDYYGREKRHV